jgi:hypothetical protein
MPVYNPAIPVAPVEYERVTYQIGLASNALLSPGLGLSTIVVGASKVTAGMLLAAAEGGGPGRRQRARRHRSATRCRRLMMRWAGWSSRPWPLVSFALCLVGLPGFHALRSVGLAVPAAQHRDQLSGEDAS